MKNIFIVAVIFIGIFTTHHQLVAQEKLNEGKVIYEISYPDMEMDPQMAAMMPTESVVYFKGNLSRTETSMGMGISSATIVNSKTNEMTALTDMMGTKTATIVDMDDQKKDKSDVKEEDLKIAHSNETKEIAGYACKKAILTNADGTTIEMFYTENITSSSQFNTQWKSLKGFPLEYTLAVGGMNMKMTAKSVTKEKISDELFKIPSDYKLMTQEEFQKMLGGEEKE